MTQYQEVIHAVGHENVTARHTSTFEITSDDYLTPAGDCILGIEADRVPAEFSAEFIKACRSAEATISVTLGVDGHTEKIEGSGHPELELTSDRSMVGRTSEYIDDRTIGIGMSDAAAGIDREFIEELSAGADLTVTITVEE